MNANFVHLDTTATELACQNLPDSALLDITVVEGQYLRTLMLTLQLMVILEGPALSERPAP